MYRRNISGFGKGSCQGGGGLVKGLLLFHINLLSQLLRKKKTALKYSWESLLDTLQTSKQAEQLSTSMLLQNMAHTFRKAKGKSQRCR